MENRKLKIENKGITPIFKPAPDKTNPMSENDPASAGFFCAFIVMAVLIWQLFR